MKCYKVYFIHPNSYQKHEAYIISDCLKVAITKSEDYIKDIYNSSWMVSGIELVGGGFE